MNHPIDPKIDCVFKALLGSEANRALLIHFLNANLGEALPAPITEGERLDPDALPTWMNTNEMQQAMSTLKTFSDKDRAYHAYQARQNYLREQRGIQRHLEELQTETEQQRAALEQERAAKEQERAAKEAALAEIERLKAQLHGRNHPDPH